MRPERIQIGNDIVTMLKSSEYLYFVTYKGLDVQAMNQFRAKLAEAGAECHVLKNNVVKKVAALNGMDIIASLPLKGDTAVVTGQGDVGAVAKIIDDSTNDTKGVISAKCGYYDGAALSAADVKAIAGLPSKDALRAQLLGLLVAVPTSLVRVLNAKASSIVNVINAYKNKLENAN